MRIFAGCVVFSLLVPIVSPAQERSPVLKDPAAGRSPFYLKIDRSTEEMFNAFLLVKKANSGDPVAQHELGLRYLTGQAFAPDTAKAALWIGRATEQHYVPAMYNFGILQNNGWGTPWDPFGAFLNFKTAAQKGLVEGMYMYGLLLTDDLVVPRDYAGAYRWISAAADSGYAFAREALEDFRKTGILDRMMAARDRPEAKDPAVAGNRRDSSASSGPTGSPASAAQAGSPSGSTLQPVFLDMSTDTLADPDDATLIEEALFRGDQRRNADTSRLNRPALSPDTIDAEALLAAAGGGSPEALTLAGRRAQMGWGVRPDTLQASIYYLRAIRCESRWSPVLLWRLVNSKGYFDRLRKSITAAGGKGASSDSTALRAGYVWASLVAMGFDGHLTGEQALGHLAKAADARMTDALVELALCYYAGYWVGRDAARGDSLMGLAAGLGSREAEVRLAMSRLRNNAGTRPEPGRIATLMKWDAEGSVLAQVMLGYCYEEGTGVPADLPVAVGYYRKAAQRGSRVAYDALKRLYDEHRPDDAMFSIPGH
jgi:TPR repeat protein